ncbi:hypothetical protein Tco_0886945 [Tanacetum coccineum]
MHTRSQSRNLHHQQHQAPPPVVEQFNLEDQLKVIHSSPAPMGDTRLMAHCSRSETHRGYEDAIVVPEITKGQILSLSTFCLNLVQNNNISLDMNKEESSCPHPIFQQEQLLR